MPRASGLTGRPSTVSVNCLFGGQACRGEQAVETAYSPRSTLTRAEKRLYLTHAWSRQLFGSTDYYPPSRFLAEIPEALVRAQGRAPSRGHGMGEHRSAVAAAAATPREPSGARGAEQIGLRIGDDVGHEKFGEGVIVNIRGEGDKAEATVRFRDAGEKTLLLAWAPLQKL